MPADRELPAVTKNRNYPQTVKHLNPLSLSVGRCIVWSDVYDLDCQDRVLDEAWIVRSEGIRPVTTSPANASAACARSKPSPGASSQAAETTAASAVVNLITRSAPLIVHHPVRTPW